MVVFSKGNLAEFLFLASDSAIQQSDVTSAAKTAASKIDAALGG